MPTRTCYLRSVVIFILSFLGLSLVASISAQAASPPQQADDRTVYQITIENLTDGQPFSPPVIATHSGSTRIFHVEEPAIDEVAAIAQAGDPAPLVELLRNVDAVTDVVNVGRPLTPAGATTEIDGATITSTATVTITATPGDFLSLTAMLICTNDGFTGLDSAVLPEDGSEVVIELNGYDVGREENTEQSADLVDACSALGPVELDGDPNGNVDDGDVLTDPTEPITLHPNISGEGDLDVDAHSWTDPVARVTIVPAADAPPAEAAPVLPQYAVTFTNLTEGQPLSPPVAATHADIVHIFQSGERATDEMAAMAQAGDPAPLVESLTGLDEVTDVVNVGRPLTPAGIITTVNDSEISSSATFTITAAPGDVFSLATMLICTNDGFTGVDAVALPEEGQQIYVLRSYDAGREENVELSATLVDACSALGPMSLIDDPDGNVDSGDVLTELAQPIARHPGISGDGDLDVDVHGWEEPVATLTITRLDTPAVADAAEAPGVEEPAIPDSGLITVQSSNSFSETVQLLQDALESQGLNVFAVIDHAQNAANADLELLPTTLILVGNPNIGTPLMQSSRTVAIDLPQKFLVWETDEAEVFITYNAPDYLAARHDITDRDELLGNVANALSNFAAAGAGTAE